MEIDLEQSTESIEGSSDSIDEHEKSSKIKRTKKIRRTNRINGTLKPRTGRAKQPKVQRLWKIITNAHI